MPDNRRGYGLSLPDFCKRVGLSTETPSGEAMRLYNATYALALALDYPLEQAYADVVRLSGEAPALQVLTVVDALSELYSRLNDCRLQAQTLAARIANRAQADENKRP